MKIVKPISEPITEELVRSLIGKYIHVPTNMHEVPNDLEGGMEETNVWFGGLVAGYEKAVMKFDFHKKEFFEGEPKVFFNILLADGMGYVLSATGDVEIREVTEDEFNDLVAEYVAEQAAKQAQEDLITGTDRTIIVPDEPKIILPEPKG